jgi:histidine ammonia-lyase
LSKKGTAPSGAFSLGRDLSLAELAEVSSGRRQVRLEPAARARAAAARKTLLSVASKGKPIYGVNTGFGELASVRIPAEQLAKLQRNLVLSHACGVGEPLAEDESRAIMFLRANELSRGHSGARPELIELMARLLNSGGAPVIPSRGSVGASGDLAPQAHMALTLLGQGQAWWRGQRVSGAAWLEKAGCSAAVLEAKEGLALLNGTQAMQAVGGLALSRAWSVWRAAQAAGAMSLEAMTGTPVPFDEAVQRLKPHEGQARAAAGLRALLARSQIRESHMDNDPRVQDPYSLRCMPQVHGSVWDVLTRSVSVFETELRSVTDNPLIVDGRVISGGNFHGMALSFACDSAAAALTALGNISERRIFQLISGQAPGLTPFLAVEPGVESGWMIAQCAAAALASENKALAHPASADSVPTSANKEDFVSMGMGAALKLKQIVFNVAQIVGIELLMAAQGVEVHAPLRPGRGVAEALSRLRARCAAARGDEVFSPRMEAARELVLAGAFDGLPS